MREGLPTPFERGMVSGNFAQDVEKSVILERKRAAYDGIAELFAKSAPYVRNELTNPGLNFEGLDMLAPGLPPTPGPELTADHVLSTSFVRDTLMTAFATEIDREPAAYHKVSENLQGYMSPNQAPRDPNLMRLKSRIGQGLTSGAAVMTSLWALIKDNPVEGKSFYDIALQPKTMNTLAAVARAWEIHEVEPKFVELGAVRDDAHGVVMPIVPGDLNADLFVVDEDGVGFNHETISVFRSDFADTKLSCPVAHMVNEVDGEALPQPLMPIKEYAKTFLEKAKSLEK